MKKLLLVLLVVTLASFLFVGCLTVPDGTEGEGEGEGEVGICPTVAVTSQVAVGGKNYIKAGSQTITVTFAVPTEPVSVYVGIALKTNPVGIPEDAAEVVLYTADGGLTYTGTVTFAGDCEEAYIYVITCDTCAPCKYPYTVDGEDPYAEIKVTIDDCDCDGCEVTFESTSTAPDCEEGEVCCGDDCSGLASWSIVIYDGEPFDDCCDPSVCEEPVDSGSGICPIEFTTDCLLAGTYYAVITLVDGVGNETVYLAKLVVSDTGDCDLDMYLGEEADAPDCVDWLTETTDIVGDSCSE
jgi:hypothetical protein